MIDNVEIDKSESAPAPTKMLSIFDSSIADKVKDVLKKAFLGQLIVIIIVIGATNILYGSSWNSPPISKTTMRIGVMINDNSNGVIAKSVKYVIDNAETFSLYYKFEYVSGMSTADFRNKVEDGVYWGALLVNSGASAKLQSAVLKNSNSSSYNKNSACVYWYDQGHAGASYQVALEYLGSIIVSAASSITKKSLMAQLSAGGRNASSVTASILTQPVGVTTVNLHDVPYNGIHTAQGVGMMQLFLVGSIQTVIVVALHMELEGRGIRRWQLLIVNVIHRVLGCAILAFWPPVVLLLLGVGTDFMNPTKFFTWWSFVWLVLGAFSGMVYHLFNVLGPAVGFLIGFFILMFMVAAGSLPIDAMPPFYRLAYGLPFLNGMEGSRAILVGSCRIYLQRNIGVLFAWVFTFFCIGMMNLFDVTRKISEWFKFELYVEEEELAIQERVAERQRKASFAMVEPFDEKLEQEEGNKPASSNEVHDISKGDNHPSKEEKKNDPQTPTAVPAPPAAPVVVLKDDLSIFDPSIRSATIPLLKKSIALEIILSILFIILLLITYGNSFNYQHYYPKIKIAFLDLDGSTIGAMASYVNSHYTMDSDFTVEVRDRTTTSYDDLYHKVKYGYYWGAFVVNAKATTSLNSHLYNTSASSVSGYASGVGATTFIYDGTRGGNLIASLLKLWSTQFTATANAVMSAKLVAAAAAAQTPFSALNSAALLSPIGVFSLNINPQRYTGIDSTISSAAMVLYLGTVVQVIIVEAGHMPLGQLGILYEHRMLAKAIHIGFATLINAFWIAISLVWYGLTLSANHFFAYWAMLWLGMCTFVAVEVIVIHLLGKQLGVMLMICLFALNQASSTQSIPLELQQRFFNIGLGLPYNQIVTAGRYIVFGSEVNIGRAIGVLVAWTAVVFIGAFRLNIRRKHFANIKIAFAKKPVQQEEVMI